MDKFKFEYSPNYVSKKLSISKLVIIPTERSMLKSEYKVSGHALFSLVEYMHILCHIRRHKMDKKFCECLNYFKFYFN